MFRLLGRSHIIDFKNSTGVEGLYMFSFQPLHKTSLEVFLACPPIPHVGMPPKVDLVQQSVRYEIIQVIESTFLLCICTEVSPPHPPENIGGCFYFRGACYPFNDRAHAALRVYGTAAVTHAAVWVTKKMILDES